MKERRLREAFWARSKQVILAFTNERAGMPAEGLRAILRVPTGDDLRILSPSDVPQEPTRPHPSEAPAATLDTRSAVRIASPLPALARSNARSSSRHPAPGQRLAADHPARFDAQSSSNPEDELSWENHRWLRYRSIMPLIQRFLNGFVSGYEWQLSPHPSRTYDQLFNADKETPLPSYKWCNKTDQRDRAVVITNKLLDFARSWAVFPDTGASGRLSIERPPGGWDEALPFDCKAPRPRPTLRITRDF